MNSAPVVVDASAIVDLLISPRLQARTLRTELATSKVALVSAPHLKAECLSAFRRQAQRKQLDTERASTSIEQMCRLDISYILPDEALLKAWDLRETMTAYDAIYAALANVYEIPLVSSDARLIKACEQEGIEAVHLGELVF